MTALSSILPKNEDFQKSKNNKASEGGESVLIRDPRTKGEFLSYLLGAQSSKITSPRAKGEHAYIKKGVPNPNTSHIKAHKVNTPANEIDKNSLLVHTSSSDKALLLETKSIAKDINVVISSVNTSAAGTKFDKVNQNIRDDVKSLQIISINPHAGMDDDGLNVREYKFSTSSREGKTSDNILKGVSVIAKHHEQIGALNTREGYNNFLSDIDAFIENFNGDTDITHNDLKEIASHLNILNPLSEDIPIGEAKSKTLISELASNTSKEAIKQNGKRGVLSNPTIKTSGSARMPSAVVIFLNSEQSLTQSHVSPEDIETIRSVFKGNPGDWDRQSNQHIISKNFTEGASQNTPAPRNEVDKTNPGSAWANIQARVPSNIIPDGTVLNNGMPMPKAELHFDASRYIQSSRSERHSSPMDLSNNEKGDAHANIRSLFSASVNEQGDLDVKKLANLLKQSVEKQGATSHAGNSSSSDTNNAISKIRQAASIVVHSSHQSDIKGGQTHHSNTPAPSNNINASNDVKQIAIQFSRNESPEKGKRSLFDHDTPPRVPRESSKSNRSSNTNPAHIGKTNITYDIVKNKLHSGTTAEEVKASTKLGTVDQLNTLGQSANSSTATSASAPSTQQTQTAFETSLSSAEARPITESTNSGQSTRISSEVPRHLPPSVFNQIKTAVLRHGRDDASSVKEIRVSLRPERLGHVDIRIEMKDDISRALIRTDNQQALEVLRSDVRGLEQALRDIGYKFDGGIDFETRMTDREHGQRGQGGDPQNSKGEQGQRHGKDSKSPSMEANDGHLTEDETDTHMEESEINVMV